MTRGRAAAWFALCMLAALLVTCAGSGCATAGRGWTRADTAAQFAIAAELAADGYQTMDYIAPNCMERNPIVGECGDRVPIPVYMPVVFAAEFLAAWALPPEWRRGVVGAFGGYEAAIIYTNHMTIREDREQRAARQR